MRFLIDADLPRATASVLARHGHEGVDVRDIGLGDAADAEIAQHAREEGFCLITGDFDFSDMRAYPPHQYPGLVVLKLPRNATARYILQLVESFLKQDRLIAAMAGRLAIVQSGRVRLRPKLST